MIPIEYDQKFNWYELEPFVLSKQELAPTGPNGAIKN